MSTCYLDLNRAWLCPWAPQDPVWIEGFPAYVCITQHVRHKFPGQCAPRLEAGCMNSCTYLLGPCPIPQLRGRTETLLRQTHSCRPCLSWEGLGVSPIHKFSDGPLRPGMGKRLAQKDFTGKQIDPNQSSVLRKSDTVGRRKGTGSIYLALNCFMALSCTGTLTETSPRSIRQTLIVPIL